jgi:hypothetical protein
MAKENTEEEDQVNYYLNQIKKHGLNSYELAKDGENGYAESAETYAWWLFPSLINFHQIIREEVNLTEAINMSIIIHSALIIEGFIYEAIKQEAGLIKDDSDLDGRIYNFFEKKLDKSSWTDLNDFFKLTFNTRLKELTDSDNWKCIVMLFYFRNMLTHSKPIKFSVKEENGELKMRHFGNYELIYNYLLEKKLIQNVNFIKSMRTELINSAIADFFWDNCQDFLANIIENSENIKMLPVYDSYQNAFEE